MRVLIGYRILKGQRVSLSVGVGRLCFGKLYGLTILIFANYCMQCLPNFTLFAEARIATATASVI